MVVVAVDNASPGTLQLIKDAVVTAVQQPGRRFAIVTIRTDDFDASEMPCATKLQLQPAICATCQCAAALGLGELSISAAGVVGCFPACSLLSPTLLAQPTTDSTRNSQQWAVCYSNKPANRPTRESELAHASKVNGPTLV